MAERGAVWLTQGLTSMNPEVGVRASGVHTRRLGPLSTMKRAYLEVAGTSPWLFSLFFILSPAASFFFLRLCFNCPLSLIN